MAINTRDADGKTISQNKIDKNENIFYDLFGNERRVTPKNYYVTMQYKDPKSRPTNTVRAPNRFINLVENSFLENHEIWINLENDPFDEISLHS